MIANFPIENYTKPYSGYPGYSCYSTLNSQQTGSVSNGPCVYSPSVSNMAEPVYYFSDPFKYYENLGSPPIAAIPNQFSSAFSSGSGSPATKSTASQPCLAAVANSQLPIGCNGYGSNSLDLSQLGTSLASLPIVPFGQHNNAAALQQRQRHDDHTL